MEFEDGSVIAQMGNPDMRLPIQYALTYPERVPCKVPPLDLPRRHNLTFFAPDEEAFPTLGLARRAAAARGNLGAIMNGANEAAVELFHHIALGIYVDQTQMEKHRQPHLYHSVSLSVEIGHVCVPFHHNVE